MSWITNKLQGLTPSINFSSMGKVAVSVVLVVAVLLTFLGMYWSSEPDQFDVVSTAKEKAAAQGYLNNSKNWLLVTQLPAHCTPLWKRC